MYNRFFDGGFNYLRIGFQEKNYYKELSVIGDANHIKAQYKKMLLRSHPRQGEYALCCGGRL